MKSLAALFLVCIPFCLAISQSCESSSLVQRSIKAIETDPNITLEAQEHQVFFNPECTQNDKLLVHLVGSFDNPANTTYFPIVAANNGFKVINLKYRNNIAASSTCKDSTDPECFSNYRQEIIFGTDSSPDVDIDVDNSILNRLEKLLIFLKSTHPTENWDVFIDESGEIAWSNVLLSGHSQGGGHAAFIAKQFIVDRVLMFASPNDYSDHFEEPADWLFSPSMTPSSRHFAFGNLSDGVVDFEKQFENWTAMNLTTQIDSTSENSAYCDYDEAQVVYTDYTFLGTGGHSNVVLDSTTPIVGDTARFAPVWKYMLGLCELTSSSHFIQIQHDDVQVFPNPSHGYLSFKSAHTISKIEILDISGKLLQSSTPNESEFIVDISSLRGLILLEISTEGSILSIRKKILVH